MDPLNLQQSHREVCPFAHKGESAHFQMPYDPLHVATRANPWLYYYQLHSEEPQRVYKIPSEGNYYLVSQYEDIRAVLADPETFSSQLFPDKDLPFILFMGGSKHRKIRELMAPVFTPAALQAFRPRLAEIVRSYTDDLIRQGSCDLLDTWSARIPLCVVADILGMDTSKARISQLTDQAVRIDKSFFPFGGTGEKPDGNLLQETILPLFRSVNSNTPGMLRLINLVGMREFIELNRNLPIGLRDNGNPRPNYRQLAAGIGPLLELSTELLEIIKRPASRKRGGWQSSLEKLKAAAGGNSLLDLFRRAWQEGKVSLVEIAMAGILVIVGGSGTTTSLLTSMTVMLAQHPAMFAYLRAHPEARDGFIEELLRLYPPLARTLRRTTRAVELGGTALPAGSQLILLNGAGNVDAKKFERPYDFSPGRAGGQQHFTFGKGPHFCPGAQLARLEARLALDELLTRLKSIQIDPAREPEFILKWDTGLYGFEHLWVVAEPG